MQKGGTVYMMSSPNRVALYTGVTSDLAGRVWEHKNKVHPTSFTSQYNCVMLVYYQHYETIEAAINEEKRIKAGNRLSKDKLVLSQNPLWIDLSETI